MMRQTLALLCSIPLLALPAVRSLHAADRALLVGVGQFQHLAGEYSLPGIDLDLDTMHTLAQQLGYAPNQIRVLLDGEATMAAVMDALGGWLVDDVSPDDQVLIYFSTHGTQVPDTNGDEEEGLDEAFLLHDVSMIANENGEPTLANVLLDDHLQHALAAIPSSKVVVILDACHSGTGTRGLSFRSLRSGSSHGLVKAYAYPGMPSGRSRGLAGGIAKGVNYVSLSAAAADERSIATGRGSLFTQALAQSVNRYLDESGEPTPRNIQDDVTRWIAAILSDEAANRMFHPQIGGNPLMFDKSLRLQRTTDGHGPLWDRVHDLAASMTPLTVRANQQTFREGDKLELSIQVPRDGYLNVVGIDPEDHAIVAFPNGLSQANRVSAGTVRIPGDLPFELPASPPYGPTLLVVFFTEQPMDLFQDANGRRDARGNMLDAFPRLSQASMRGFLPTAIASSTRAAATLEVRICPAAGCN